MARKTPQPVASDAAPQSWKPDVRAKWPLLPADVREEILRVDRERAMAVRRARLAVGLVAELFVLLRELGEHEFRTAFSMPGSREDRPNPFADYTDLIAEAHKVANAIYGKPGCHG